MKDGYRGSRKSIDRWVLASLLAMLALFAHGALHAFTLNVVDSAGAPIAGGYRYLVEVDTTNLTVPAAPVNNSISLDIHNSYAPPVTTGTSAGGPTEVTVPDGRYFVTVLPDAPPAPGAPNPSYALGGAPITTGPCPVATVPCPVAAEQTSVTVIVTRHPMPTAQISVLAFVDQQPINNAWDEHDPFLGGAKVQIADFSGGAVSQDAFGNLLGTTYQRTCDPTGQNPGSGTDFCLDADGIPVVDVMGTGNIYTLTQDQFNAGGASNPYNLTVGEALVKYLPPGKYGVTIVPPQFDDNMNPITWSQTTTIEGTPVIDAWVKANEPNIFVEGFGTGFKHVAFGFVKIAPTTDSPFKGQVFSMLPWNVTPAAGTGTIQGTLRSNHFSRPPNNQGYFAGEPVPECWVGLNDPLAQPGTGQPAGLIVAKCDANSHFVINNVPPGTYQLVSWETPLDYLFGFNTVTVGSGENVNLGDVLVFRWFGNLEGNVFLDADLDGFRDSGETGIMNQAVNLRFRDGSVYQATTSDSTGEYALSEVFPFFKWLVVEVDYLRYRATGMTAAVDYGGQIPPENGWIMPSFGKLNPQPQAAVNPNTGNNLSRTETGPVLTQAMHLFLNQTNVIDWGKVPYPAGENGGISGIVFYDTTRAENDPKFNAGEPWQPGVPRVQVVLYQDTNGDGIIDDINGVPGVQLADVDNFPFGWADGSAPMGPEDVKRNGAGTTFNQGDALEVASTDSWDDNKPSGCVQDLPIIHGSPAPECADAYGTWNQVRPGLFDGGYAFGEAAGGVLATGTYIVETVPPPVYEVVKEEDKNVDFGNPYTPSPLLTPPPCVGTVANGNPLHTVPSELSLFPGVPIDPPLAGSVTPLCNMKQVTVIPGQNTAADFFHFTMVPKAARAVGFVNNDLAAEFNMASPNFGEKLSPSWIPVSFRDWAGNEITRVYTDEFGGYNALLPSTFSIYVPTPSGVAPNMITLVLNDPVFPDGSPDPFYNPIYSVTPWTFNYTPGTTSYLDTPIVPTAAFSASGTALDTMPADLTPEIAAVAVTAPGAQAGPLVCDPTSESTITITSVGLTDVLNPAYVPAVGGVPFLITRNYGFGSATGTVTLDGTPLDVTGWTDTEITATVPADSSTGRLMVTRGDNGFTTEVGATLLIDDCSAFTVLNVPADYASIQEAVDDATAGDVIVVEPGHYNENVIMYKPVRLLGSGAGGTIIDGNPTPLERLQFWHDGIDALGGAAFEAFLLKPIFMENEASGIVVFGETIYPMGDIQTPNANCDVAHNVYDPAFCNLFNPGNPFDTPGQASILNFTISGSKAGGAIFAASGARHLTVRTNVMTGNQGNYAGGIDLGIPDNGFDNKNGNITVRQNKIHRNGGFQGAGGIAVCEYANDYLIEENLIFGNFSRFNGGGINHRGVIPGANVIRKNRILFNEVFFGALLALAGDGAGIHIGGDIVAGTGSGSVTVDSNLIQGNLAGAGYGGGIRAFSVNAADITGNPNNDPPTDPAVDPPQWYQLRITNNIIVNNVAGAGGGGISLSDVYRPVVMNNTIANNDSTSTSRLTFAPGELDSTPQPAGIHSTANSTALQAGLIAATAPGTDTTGFSNPQLVNNIIWRNRSFFNDASLNGGAGGLSPHPTIPFWDLGVTGTVAAGFMNPDDSILTSLTYADGSNYNDGSNIAANPLFVSSYVNALESATVIDEGGNNINVRFLPLSVTGDYHITAASPAVDAGQVVANDHDYDGEVRPNVAFDIGADEVYAGTVPPAPAYKIGVFRAALRGQWYLDANGNGAWDAGSEAAAFFGTTGDISVAGDWNGTGTTKIGVFRNGAWYLDVNGNGVWDPGTDTVAYFGTTGDIPVTGDWNGTGTTKIGVFRNGAWYLDVNGNGAWNAGTDTVAFFGTTGDVPVTGDWNGSGTTKIGAFRNGAWYLDVNGNGAWNAGTDTVAFFGTTGDVPVTGDWNGSGTTKIGAFRNGSWYLDVNGNGAWNAGTDTISHFGTAGDQPIAGKW